MSNVDFELNLAGLNELMKSPEMQSHLEVASATYHISPEDLMDGFRLIRQEWKTGVTQ